MTPEEHLHALEAAVTEARTSFEATGDGHAAMILLLNRVDELGSAARIKTAVRRELDALAERRRKALGGGQTT